VTLIAASIVVPPVTARLLTDSFGTMLILSMLIGMSGGIFGMFFSFEWDIASGAAIVLFLTAVFLVVYTGTTIRTLIRDRAPAVAPETAIAPGLGSARMRPAHTDDHLFD
jgi:manganese/iron transport system permease protein/iron/zinc/copper transport system permease protein